MHFPVFQEIVRNTSLKNITYEDLRSIYERSIADIINHRPDLIEGQNRARLVSMLNRYGENGEPDIDYITRDFSLLHEYCLLIPTHIKDTLPVAIMPHCHQLIMHAEDVEVYILCISIAHIANDIEGADESIIEFLVSRSIPFVEEGNRDFDHPWALMIFLRKHPQLLIHHRNFIDYIFLELRKNINRRITVTDIITECIDPILSILLDSASFSEESAIAALNGFFSLIHDLNQDLGMVGPDPSALLTVGIRFLSEANRRYFEEGRFEELHISSEKIILQLRHLYNVGGNQVNQALGEKAEKLFHENGFYLDMHSAEEICQKLKNLL